MVLAVPKRSPLEAISFTVRSCTLATFRDGVRRSRAHKNARRHWVRIRRTGLMVALALSGVALVAGGALSSASAGARSSSTIKGVTGGTFTSQTGNPAAVSSTGSPSPTKGDLYGVTISVKSGAGLPESQIGVLGGENEKAECTGTFKNPTAPPGFVCVYLDLDNSVNIYQGMNAAGVVVTGEGNALAQAAPIGSGKFGVSLTWYAAAPGPSTLYATYAYMPA